MEIKTTNQIANLIETKIVYGNANTLEILEKKWVAIDDLKLWLVHQPINKNTIKQMIEELTQK